MTKKINLKTLKANPYCVVYLKYIVTDPRIRSNQYLYHSENTLDELIIWMNTNLQPQQVISIIKK